MIIKLKNCNVLTNTSNGMLFGTEIMVCDNKIMQIGKSGSTMQTDFEIDLDGALVIPGLNNMFCFPYSLGINSSEIVNSNDFEMSISYVKNRIENNLDSKSLNQQFLAGGIAISGIIDCNNFKDFDFNTIRFISFDSNLEENVVKKIVESSKIKPILLLDDILKFSDEDILKFIQISNKFNLVIAVRVSKTLEIAGEIDKQTGLSPISYIESLGLLDRKCILLDCTVLDKEDINLLSQYTSVSVAISPETDMMLGNGIAPICSYLNKGINVVLGFDNLACSNIDLFREMYLAKNLQIVSLSDLSAIQSDKVFKMATDNFERILDLKVGKIKEGYLANLAVIKNNRIDYSNIYDSIINFVSSNDVVLTMINGKIVYKK